MDRVIIFDTISETGNNKKDDALLKNSSGFTLAGRNKLILNSPSPF